MVNLTIPSGTHVITWQYRKDVSDTAGQDCGWVDKVVDSGGGGSRRGMPGVYELLLID
jgi:hypothetical protein